MHSIMLSKSFKSYISVRYIFIEKTHWPLARIDLTSAACQTGTQTTGLKRHPGSVVVGQCSKYI